MGRKDGGSVLLCSTPDGIDDRDGTCEMIRLFRNHSCSTPDGIDDRDGIGCMLMICAMICAQRLTASMIATGVRLAREPCDQLVLNA